MAALAARILEVNTCVRRKTLIVIHFQLEAEFEGRSSSKKQKTGIDSIVVPSTSKTPAQIKAGEKRLKGIVKEWFDRCVRTISVTLLYPRRWRRRLTSPSIKIDEVLSEEDFKTLFLNKGTLIQPTPDNKPTSLLPERQRMEPRR
ncbi:uncharacterized protein EI90DRAFT_3045694 [Cantharellus anzutake]|uniref:uncharacterized protein n=1 Tax=Cantharellus anzutake TaxID=1750568 RepID=UPI0019073209|nr:uncharacterized protein EI90DRAFT_3045694 [Cantharellus anzutake]KAF8336421.1 hypothetical protein EI90DRAFT_3045694 [Cantharellus anzutake]